MDTKVYEKGKLYSYDGNEFTELQKLDDLIKVPVTLEANEAVKTVRNRVAKVIGARPEMSIVASAMLIEAAKMDNLEIAVRKYGAKLYQS